MNKSRINSIYLITLLLYFFTGVTLNAATFTEEEIANTYSYKDLEQKPEPTKQVQPKISKELEGAAGKVYVAFIVGANGKVQNLRCVKSTEEKLNEPVLAAVKQWKFKPGINDGKKVAVRVVLPVRIDFS